jgi:hypothetical protein
MRTLIIWEENVMSFEQARNSPTVVNTLAIEREDHPAQQAVTHEPAIRYVEKPVRTSGSAPRNEQLHHKARIPQAGMYRAATVSEL